MDDYYATRVSPAPAEASLPGQVLRPATASIGSVAGRWRLLILVVVGVVAIALVRQFAVAAQPSPLHEVASPAPASAGWGPEFTDSLGRPARLNPCEAMPYAVNLTGAPAGALAVVKGAVKSLTAASGLQFTYAGLTADRAAATTRPSAHAHDPRRFLIAWTTPGTSLGDSADPSASTYTRAAPTANGPVIVGASIVVNSDRHFSEGGDVSHESLRLVMLHELGHAVGLRHVDDPSQVMSPVAHLWLSEYGRGDRLGLSILGSGGCLRAP